MDVTAVERPRHAFLLQIGGLIFEAPKTGPVESNWTSDRISSVGGSAMHMKCPDDIGRVAGIGDTPGWRELTNGRGARDDWPSVG